MRRHSIAELRKFTERRDPSIFSEKRRLSTPEIYEQIKRRDAKTLADELFQVAKKVITANTSRYVAKDPNKLAGLKLEIQGLLRIQELYDIAKDHDAKQAVQQLLNDANNYLHKHYDEPILDGYETVPAPSSFGRRATI